MKPSISVNLHLSVDTVPQLIAALKALEHREVLVGYPSDGVEREPDEDGREPATNAEIAYIQNNGSPARGIPAREFMASGVESVKDKIVQAGQQAGRQALDGNLDAVGKGLVAMGLIGEEGIKQRLANGNFTPLKAQTLRRRRLRGRTGTKPLNDTGQLIAAVTSVVRDVQK